jgi:PST family polysaccharide transporter
LKKLIKATLKSGSSVALINLSFLGAIKLIAVNFGPSGIGLFSLIKQIIATFSSIGMGAQTSVVLGISKNLGIEKWKNIVTSFYYYLCISIVTICLYLNSAQKIAVFFTKNSIGDGVTNTKLLLIPIILLIWYTYLKSIVNGYKKIGRLSFLEAINPISIFFFLALISFLKLDQAHALFYIFVLILSLGQFIAILFSLYVIFDMKIKISNYRFSQNSKESKFFLKTSLVTIITGVVSGVSLFLVRTSIIKASSLSGAGIFDIAWTISNTYPMLILSAISVYYMPHLSSLKNQSKQNQFINSTLRFSILFMTPLITLLIATKPLIVLLVSSKNFIGSVDILRWTLIADFLKVSSWIFALAVFAKHRINFYCISEVAWYFSLALFSFISTYYFHDIEFIGIFLVVLYLLSSINYLIYARKIYKLTLNKGAISLWLASFLSIVFFSMVTWETKDFMLIHLVLWLVFLLFYLHFLLKQSEKQHVISFFYKFL